MRIVHGRFCWFAERTFPRESQWSLLHKFVAWNALSHRAAHAHLARLRTLGPANLSLRAYIDPQRWKWALGLPTRQIYQSWPGWYLRREERGLVFQTLRYCPACLRCGYHSALHQIALFETCPVHHLPLEQACPSCGRRISLETSGKNLRHPYACPECLMSFLPALNVEQTVLAPHEVRAFEEVGRAMMTVLGTRQGALPLWGVGYPRSPGSSSPAYNYLRFWEDLYGAPSCLRAENSPIVARKERWERGGKKRCRHWTPYGIYKSIRRHVFTKRIRRHRACLGIIRELGGVFAGFECSAPIGCPVAHAYIAWRMCWEGWMTISGLLLDDRPADLTWRCPEGLDAAEGERIFGVECLASFDVFYTRAKMMANRGIFRIETPDEIQRLTPFVCNWALCRNAGGEQNVLWSWVPSSGNPSTDLFDAHHKQGVVSGVLAARKALRAWRGKNCLGGRHKTLRSTGERTK